VLYGEPSSSFSLLLAAFLKMLESLSSRKLSQLFKVKADLIVQVLAPFGQAIRVGNRERFVPEFSTKRAR